MATNFRMDPDVLDTRSSDVARLAEATKQTCKDLSDIVTRLQDEWEGQSAQSFQEQYLQLKNPFEQMGDLMEAVSKQLHDTAESVRQMDESISRSFQL